MSLTYSPSGLRPMGYNQYASYEGGYITFPLTTNNTAAIAIGDPVGLVGGSVVDCTGNPTPGTLSANSILGVAFGFQYTAPSGQPVAFRQGQLLPANAVTGGYTNISVMVVPAGARLFEVQANGVVTFAQLGAGINLGGFGAANTTYGSSGVYADTTTINQTGGNTAAWKIVAISHNQDNVNTNSAGYVQALAGDLYTKILIQAQGSATTFGLVGAQ